jgi:hypothetical protein
MKTFTLYKSLLLAGGLLLICLTGLHLGKPNRPDIATAIEKHAGINSCDMDPAGGSYLKDIAEKLFPVLKSLNLM